MIFFNLEIWNLYISLVHEEREMMFFFNYFDYSQGPDSTYVSGVCIRGWEMGNNGTSLVSTVLVLPRKRGKTSAIGTSDIGRIGSLKYRKFFFTYLKTRLYLKIIQNRSYRIVSHQNLSCFFFGQLNFGGAVF